MMSQIPHAFPLQARPFLVHDFCVLSVTDCTKTLELIPMCGSYIKYLFGQNKNCKNFIRYFKTFFRSPKYRESPTTGRKIPIFLYCVRKTFLVNYFQKYTIKVQASSYLVFWNLGKLEIPFNQPRWPIEFIKKHALISYSL